MHAKLFKITTETALMGNSSYYPLKKKTVSIFGKLIDFLFSCNTGRQATMHSFQV